MTTDPDTVVDDVANHRFLLVQEGAKAELVYRRVGTRLVLTHTGVPQPLSGRGIGSRLVRAAVERARQDGLTLVPYCPFARKWLEDHADVVGAVGIEWSTDEPGESQRRG